MRLVILALLPPFLFGIHNTGYQSNLASGADLALVPVVVKGVLLVMPLVTASYGVGFFWEILFSIVRKHPISEGFLVTGLLFPMTLPPTIPLWQAAVGISFGVGIGNYRIIVGGILGVLCTGYFLNLVASDASSAWLFLNPSYHLVMGDSVHEPVCPAAGSFRCKDETEKAGDQCLIISNPYCSLLLRR